MDCNNCNTLTNTDSIAPVWAAGVPDRPLDWRVCLVRR
jgi:hypothetical protein